MKPFNLKVKSLLVKKGITFADIGRSLKKPVTGQMVSDVARGVRKSPRIRRAIARRLGIAVRELFSDYTPARRKSLPQPVSDSE